MNNPRFGLLYNWPAATGNQNPSTTGTDQGEQADGTDPTLRVQGICPDGWHLPSDKEWNDLEAEIYNFPQKYISYADNSSFAPLQSNWRTYNQPNPQRPSQGSNAHGKAMKDPCAVAGGNTDGRSKTVLQGGFSLLLVGDANTHFGATTDLWSSSSYNSQSAWERDLAFLTASVVRNHSLCYSLCSIRCKKD
jgi:uncharacterized protein (TIGR02145 family)